MFDMRNTEGNTGDLKQIHQRITVVCIQHYAWLTRPTLPDWVYKFECCHWAETYFKEKER